MFRAVSTCLLCVCSACFETAPKVEPVGTTTVGTSAGSGSEGSGSDGSGASTASGATGEADASSGGMPGPAAACLEQAAGDCESCQCGAAFDPGCGGPACTPCQQDPQCAEALACVLTTNDAECCMGLMTAAVTGVAACAACAKMDCLGPCGIELDPRECM